VADRFYKDIELPVVSSVPTPDAGFVSLYGKGDKLAVKNSAGVEVLLENTVIDRVIIDGGNAATAAGDFKLRFDFGMAT
jgi:hypothetical protein